MKHYRNTSQCTAVEELEPVDQNLNYDFDFQVKLAILGIHLINIVPQITSSCPPDLLCGNTATKPFAEACSCQKG